MANGKKVGGGIALIISAVLAVEGGYVFDKDDPGGETNHGITKRVAVSAGYTKPMKDLTQDDARAIYYKNYVVQPGFEPVAGIDIAVAEELIDTGANMGPAKPSRWLQQSLNEVCGSGLRTDGQIGKGTVAALAKCEAADKPKVCIRILDALDARQKAEYLRLIRINPVLAKYRRGWLNYRIGNVSRAKCLP